MEKLTYTKIANITLKIDLHNGYEVVVLAEYNENAKKYTAKFYIKDKLVDDLMLMEDFDNTEFIGNEKIACSNILKFVSKKLKNGSFDKYMTRIEYYQDCFDRGDTMYRNEEKVLRPIRSDFSYNSFHCPECDFDLDSSTEYCPQCKVWLDWDNIVEPEDYEKYMIETYGERYYE